MTGWVLDRPRFPLGLGKRILPASWAACVPRGFQTQRLAGRLLKFVSRLSGTVRPRPRAAAEYLHEGMTLPKSRSRTVRCCRWCSQCLRRSPCSEDLHSSAPQGREQVRYWASRTPYLEDWASKRTGCCGESHFLCRQTAWIRQHSRQCWQDF